MDVSSEAERYEVGPLSIDVDDGTVVTATGALDLPPLTFRLLVLLVRASPNTARSENLLDELWPGRFVGDENLKQRVYRLRKALAPYGVEIETVRGWGYRMITPVRTSTTPAVRSDDRYQSAMGFIDRLEFGKAAAVLEEVLADRPGFDAARISLAWSLMWLGRPDDAQDRLLPAVSRVDEMSPLERHWTLATHASFSGDLPGAIDHYELALSEAPETKWLVINLGGCYLTAGRLDEARSLAETWSMSLPDDPVTSWQAGMVRYLAFADLEGASPHLRRVAELAPEWPWPLPRLLPGLSAWARGDYDEALSMFDTELGAVLSGLWPMGSTMGLELRSRLLGVMGDTDAALSDLDRAIDVVAGGQWDHHLLRGHLLLEQALIRAQLGEPLGELLVPVLEARPALPRAQGVGWLAVAAGERGDHAGMEGHLRRLRDLRYEHGWVWGVPSRPAFDLAKTVFHLLATGELALATGRPAEASAAFQRAVTAAPRTLHSPTPLGALDPRCRLAALDGLARALEAGDSRAEAQKIDRQLVSQPIVTGMLAGAGWVFEHRARARMMERQNPVEAIRHRDGPVAAIGDRTESPKTRSLGSSTRRLRRTSPSTHGDEGSRA